MKYELFNTSTVCAFQACWYDFTLNVYGVFISAMTMGPVDPREILKGVEALLGKDGELRSLEGVPKVFR